MNGLHVDHAAGLRVVADPPPPFDPIRRLVALLIGRAAFWVVFLATLATIAIYHKGHADDHVGQNVPPSTIKAGAVSGAPCGTWGTVTRAWLDNADGPARIFDIACSGLPAGTILTWSQP